ncbi:hypothetical protein PIB30_037018 [Stylosanthes scabra]|uniref:Uncharacterized protein n=1 Tax=Stylosanthes scabra TaxID=79078 RepID=A0ABU6RDQ7_9FABA|nr:hypothetical protein [Stylosanthes scabra]
MYGYQRRYHREGGGNLLGKSSLQKPPNNSVSKTLTYPFTHDHWTTSLASVPSICPKPSAIPNPNPLGVLKVNGLGGFTDGFGSLFWYLCSAFFFIAFVSNKFSLLLHLHTFFICFVIISVRTRPKHLNRCVQSYMKWKGSEFIIHDHNFVMDSSTTGSLASPYHDPPKPEGESFVLDLYDLEMAI